MTPARDRYHDYLSAYELEDCTRSLTAEAMLRLRIDSLCRRANPNGCLSGFYELRFSYMDDAYIMRAYFAPVVWTGHDGSTPLDIVRRWWAKLRR